VLGRGDSVAWSEGGELIGDLVDEGDGGEWVEPEVWVAALYAVGALVALGVVVVLVPGGVVEIHDLGEDDLAAVGAWGIVEELIDLRLEAEADGYDEVGLEECCQACWWDFIPVLAGAGWDEDLDGAAGG
jgi:hypothetical protein